MRKKEALDIIRKTAGDPGEKQQVLRGLHLLAKFDENIDTSFEHDQLWASDFEQTATRMTVEEVTEMARLDWFCSEESWSHF